MERRARESAAAPNFNLPASLESGTAAGRPPLGSVPATPDDLAVSWLECRRRLRRSLGAAKRALGHSAHFGCEGHGPVSLRQLETDAEDVQGEVARRRVE